MEQRKTTAQERLAKKIEARKKAAEEASKRQTKRDLSPEEAEDLAERERKKAALAQVLDRGMVNSRLEIRDGRPDKHYAFVRDRREDIDKAKALGFEIETEAGAGLHGTGDGTRRIGDVVLMSTSRANYELIEEVKADRRRRRHEAVDPKKDYLRKARMKNPDVPAVNLLEEEV